MKAVALICLVLAVTHGYLVETKISLEQNVVAPEGAIGDTVQVFEGIMYGFFKQLFPLNECISEAKLVVSDFEKAYFYFKKGKKNVNPSDIAEALKFAADAIRTLPAAVGDCKDAAQVIWAVERILQTLSNPASFVTKIGKALIFHGKEITTDVFKAVAYWEGKDFFHFGEMIGRIAEITLSKPKGTIGNTGLVMKGILYGFFNQLFPIDDCIDETKLVITDFEKAYFYFKKGKAKANPADISEAMKYVADGVKTLPAAVGDCESVVTVLWAVE